MTDEITDKEILQAFRDLLICIQKMGGQRYPKDIFDGYSDKKIEAYYLTTIHTYGNWLVEILQANVETLQTERKEN